MNLIFVEGETDCTSEKAGGQFSIFGAVEEMGALDFSELARTRKLVEYLCKPHGMRGSDGGVQSGKVGESRMGGLSTESAQEMQKGGAGNQPLGEELADGYNVHAGGRNFPGAGAGEICDQEK